MMVDNRITCVRCHKGSFEYCGMCAVMSSYGRPSPEQWEVLHQHCKDQVVLDLGSGPQAGLSEVLATSGAKRVYAIDKQHLNPSRQAALLAAGVEYQQRYISDVALDIQTGKLPNDAIALISWPQTRYLKKDPLVDCIRSLSKVIYLGKNTDGTGCGGQPFFRHLLRRPVLAHVASPKNTLLVYGTEDPTLNRLPYGEELGGLATMVINYNAACLVDELYATLHAA